MTHRPVGALVLAAGSGTRLGGQKQFLELAPGVRFVDAAVRAVQAVTDTVVVVLPEAVEWDGAPVTAAVTGGADRRASVGAGLAALPAAVDIVVVHDAAHPLAPHSAVYDVVAAVRSGADAAVPFLPVPDVVKRRHHDGTLTTVGRDGLGLAQVPMAFARSALHGAHGQPWESDEDSALVERLGGRVVAVAGSTRNIHVVSAEDVGVVRALALGHVEGREGRSAHETAWARQVH